MKADIGEVWSRLRSHRGWRITTGYLAGGMATTLAVAELYDVVGLPDATPRVVLFGMLAGFPIVLALVWATSRGTEDEHETRDRAPGQPPGDGSASSATPMVERDARLSILVTPLRNQSPDPENEFVADGVTEEIITDLSQLDALRVIARPSAMKLKGGGEPLLRVARGLAVDYMLEGSVRRAGDQLRITVRLVAVATEATMWSERFDGAFEEIFDMQTAVARSVADHLELHLTPDELQALERTTLGDPRAYEAYMRARFETLRFTEEGLRNAEVHLQNALRIVGGNALLYATLGQTYTWYSQLGRDPDGAYLQRARECVDRIFEVEPESPRGHLLQGLVRFTAGELRQSAAPLHRALRSMPTDPDLLLMVGYLTAIRGQHDRAREALERCQSVDPLTPLAQAMPGFLAVLEGRFDDAIPYYARYREMDPDSPFAAWCWFWALTWAGRIDEAKGHLDEQTDTHGDSLFFRIAGAMVPALAGDRAGTLARLDDEIRHSARSNELFSRELTHCLALAGEVDEALEWLENTIRIGNVNYPFWSRHNWQIENLRGDPRYASLMAQVEREWQAINPQLAG